MFIKTIKIRKKTDDISYHWQFITKEYQAPYIILVSNKDAKELTSGFKFLFSKKNETDISEISIYGKNRYGEKWLIKKNDLNINAWINDKNLKKTDIHDIWDIIMADRAYNRYYKISFYEFTKINNNFHLNIKDKKDFVLSDSLYEKFLILVNDCNKEIKTSQDKFENILQELLPIYENYKLIKNFILETKKEHKKFEIDLENENEVMEKLQIIKKIDNILKNNNIKINKIENIKKDFYKTKENIEKLHKYLKINSNTDLYDINLYKDHIDILSKIHIQQFINSNLKDNKFLIEENIKNTNFLINKWEKLAKFSNLDPDFRLKDLYNLIYFNTKLIFLYKKFNDLKNKIKYLINDLHLIKQFVNEWYNKKIKYITDIKKLIDKAQEIISRDFEFSRKFKDIINSKNHIKYNTNIINVLYKKLDDIILNWNKKSKLLNLNLDISNKNDFNKISKLLKDMHLVVYILKSSILNFKSESKFINFIYFEKLNDNYIEFIQDTDQIGYLNFITSNDNFSGIRIKKYSYLKLDKDPLNVSEKSKNYNKIKKTIDILTTKSF